MQVETLHNVPRFEPKQYLRVATIANKTALCYFYIGTDENSIQFLSESFHTGLIADDYKSAKEALRANADIVDVIIIDVAYNEKELRDFHSFLKNIDLLPVPVIYNDCHMKNE